MRAFLSAQVIVAGPSSHNSLTVADMVRTQVARSPRAVGKTVGRRHGEPWLIQPYGITHLLPDYWATSTMPSEQHGACGCQAG
jgi:hypothetical protein